MSSMDILCSDFVKVWKASAQVATNCVDIPGMAAAWKYIFASLIRLSLGIGYLSIDQLQKR